jgi:antirestriction protein ArdC
MSGRFGDEEYAAEELLAELTSAFLSAELGLQADLKDPARYLKSWIRILKKDKYAIFTASRKAQDAATFLQDLQPAEDGQDAA